MVVAENLASVESEVSRPQPTEDACVATGGTRRAMDGVEAVERGQASKRGLASVESEVSSPRPTEDVCSHRWHASCHGWHGGRRTRTSLQKGLGFNNFDNLLPLHGLR